MDRKALERARQHFADAEVQFGILMNCTTSETMVRAWSVFMIDTQRVFSKLAAGAKGRQSEPWFGNIKSDRKEDPLLKYVHQARHAEEHGLDITTAEAPGFLAVRNIDPSKPVSIGPFYIDDNNVPHFSSIENGRVVFAPTSIKLAPVRNKGKSFDPPTEHLGKAIDEPSPSLVGYLLLLYLREKLEEAATFIVP